MHLTTATEVAFYAEIPDTVDPATIQALPPGIARVKATVGWTRGTLTSDTSGVCADFTAKVRVLLPAHPAWQRHAMLCHWSVTRATHRCALHCAAPAPPPTPQLGDVLLPSTPICTVKPCPHSKAVDNVCIMCGAQLQPGPHERESIDALTPGPQLQHFKVRGGFSLQMTDMEARRSDEMHHTSLLARRKLTLTLDLDHTLLHTVNSGLTAPTYAEITAAVQAASAAFPGQVHTFQLSNDARHEYHMKVRRDIQAFLQAAAEHFELAVDTAGTREYAAQAVQVLDPASRFFGVPARIVSRCDTQGRVKHTRWAHSSLTDDAMVLIVDDTEVVWAGAPNLAVIDAYKFWKAGAAANNAAGRSLVQVDAVPEGVQPETPASAMVEAVKHSQPSPTPEHPGWQEEPHPRLKQMLRVLLRAHAGFYQAAGIAPAASTYATAAELMHEPDAGAWLQLDALPQPGRPVQVRALMPGEVEQPPVLGKRARPATPPGSPPAQPSAGPAASATGADATIVRPPLHVAALLHADMSAVLGGCTILFSRVFPRDVDMSTTPLFRRVLAFGARIALTLDPTVTHVVSTAPGTEKVKAAAAMPGVRCVHLRWLQESCVQYRRLPEREYALPGLEASTTRAYTAAQLALAQDTMNKLAAKQAQALQAWRARTAGEPLGSASLGLEPVQLSGPAPSTSPAAPALPNEPESRRPATPP